MLARPIVLKARRYFAHSVPITTARMTSTQQKALFLVKKQGDFAVHDTSIPSPAPGEVLVKIHAAALNPVDWKLQEHGKYVEKYPAVLGFDAAGVVEELGEGVNTFAKGDRVIFQGTVDNRNATYQQYAVSPAEITAKLPNDISFSEGASVPVCFTTSAVALYQKGNLGGGLTAPWEEGGKDKYDGQPIVVLGGASSVGQYAIQLAKLSGFSPIITTASLHNEAHLKSLGATHVIGRNAPLAPTVHEITSEPSKFVFDTISNAETQAAGFELLGSGGQLLLCCPSEIPEGKLVNGKKATTVFGSGHPPQNREFGKALYAVLTGLLEDGHITPNRVEELPGGLGGIVGGLERLKENKVSGTKLVALPQDTK